MKSSMRALAIISAVLAAGTVSAQTIADVDHQRMPAAQSPAIDESWQQMRLHVDHRSVDNTLLFAPDGTLRVQFTRSKRGVNGRWSIQPGKLCMQFPVRGTECFDYTQAPQQGQTVPIRSDRGWTGTVTMLTDAIGSPLARTLPVIAAR